MDVIEVENVSYRYPDGTLALEDVSFRVREGEGLALLGPNGAGKTTLLLILMGVLKPERGRISILGRDVRGIKDVFGKAGMLFQEPDDQLFMPTVFDEVAFGPINMGMRGDKLEEVVQASLRMVGLSGYEKRCPHNLSMGEKRKVCIASVLSMDPRILLLDEPTSNLDPSSRSELLKILKRLKKEGRTVVIATHDVGAALEIAERAVVLNKRVVDEGDLKEIFRKPHLLHENKLEVPDIVRLLSLLNLKDGFPSSVEEAAEIISRFMRNP